MRVFLLLGLAAAAAPALQPPPPPAKPSPIYAANERLGRGVNFANALEAPKEGEWGVTLSADYFRKVKEAGFDSVRLPVRWSAHAAAAAPYTIEPKFAERIDWAIDQALANKLAIVVNCHHYDELDADPDAHAPRMIALWEQIAARYKDRPATVYFEPLNEPHDKLTPEKWNAVFPKLLAAVRKTNPTRPVVVGPGSWNAIRELDKLQLPADDRNLIVTVHYYDPFEFTHQGAPWAKGSDKWKGRKWQDTEAERAAVTKALTRAAEYGQKHDRPVFLGEFGAYEVADMDSRAKWTRWVAAEARRLKMSAAYWDFCAGFGVYDPKAGTWREPLKAALLP